MSYLKVKEKEPPTEDEHSYTSTNNDNEIDNIENRSTDNLLNNHHYKNDEHFNDDNYTSTKLLDDDHDYVEQAHQILADAVDPEDVFLSFRRDAEEQSRRVQEVDVSNVSATTLSDAAQKADQHLDQLEREQRQAVTNVDHAHKHVRHSISRAMNYVISVWRMWQNRMEQQQKGKRDTIQDRLREAQHGFQEILREWKHRRKYEHGKTVIRDADEMLHRRRQKAWQRVARLFGIDRRSAILTLHQMVGVRNKIPYGRYFLRVAIHEHLGGPKVSKTACSQIRRHNGAYDAPVLSFDDESISLPSFYRFQAYTVYVFELVLSKDDFAVTLAWGAFPASSMALDRMRGYAVVPLLRGAVDPYINSFQQYHDVYRLDLDRWVANLYFTVQKHITRQKKEKKKKEDQDEQENVPGSKDLNTSPRQRYPEEYNENDGDDSSKYEPLLHEDDDQSENNNKNDNNNKNNNNNNITESEAMYSIDIETKTLREANETNFLIQRRQRSTSYRHQSRRVRGIGPEMRFLFHAMAKDMGITTTFTAVLRMAAVVAIGLWSGSMVYGLCLWAVLGMAGVPGVYPTWHPLHIHLHAPTLPLYVDLMLLWISPLIQTIIISSILLIISAVHRAEHGLSAYVSRIAFAVHITWCFAAPLSNSIACVWDDASCQSILPHRMYRRVDNRPVEQFWVVILATVVYCSVAAVGLAVAHLFLMWGYMGGIMGDMYRRFHTHRRDAVPRDMALSHAELLWMVRQFSRQDLGRRVTIYQYEGKKGDESETQEENIKYAFRVVGYEDGKQTRQIVLIPIYGQPNATEVMNDDDAANLISQELMVPLEQVKRKEREKKYSYLM